ncbi:MAG TPA: mechanosensitive ion channel protein MscS, partial [Balneolaceae bacterium]|nr:mechanosensitive ion channel protein MscS [Balneolaceae bacterium]
MELNNIYDTLVGKLEMWLSTAIEMLPNLAMALLVVVIFYALAKVIKNTVGKLLGQVTENKTV